MLLVFLGAIFFNTLAGYEARCTRGRRPVTLLATWHFTSKGEALRTERAIKGLSRQQKWQLVLDSCLEGGLPTPRAPSTTYICLASSSQIGLKSPPMVLETVDNHEENSAE